MDTISIFEHGKREGWKICMYGLGLYGTSCGLKVMSYLDIQPDFVCDKDVKKLEEFEYDSEKKITIEELKTTRENILVFIFLSSKYMKQVYEELGQYKHLHFISWEGIHELLDKDEILQKYYEINVFKKDDNDRNKFESLEYVHKKNNRIAVYVCITGGYDELNIPTYIENNCDYYLITDIPSDQKIMNDEYYRRINVNDIVPEEVETPKEQNRYCKSHGYEIFPEYQYTVYIDGNVRICSPIAGLVSCIGNTGIALHKHPYAKDAYVEVMSLALRDRVKEEETKITMPKLAKEGFPRDYGMPECGVIFVDNGKVQSSKILDRWYKNYRDNEVKRDQIYMAYTLWQFGISMEEVITLPGTIRSNGYFATSHSHSGYQR